MFYNSMKPQCYFGALRWIDRRPSSHPKQLWKRILERGQEIPQTLRPRTGKGRLRPPLQPSIENTASIAKQKQRPVCIGRRPTGRGQVGPQDSRRRSTLSSWCWQTCNPCNCTDVCSQSSLICKSTAQSTNQHRFSQIAWKSICSKTKLPWL